jgi:hypothetical protein
VAQASCLSLNSRCFDRLEVYPTAFSTGCERRADSVTAVLPGTQRRRKPVARPPQPLLVPPNLSRRRRTLRRRREILASIRPQHRPDQIRLRQKRHPNAQLDLAIRIKCRACIR